MYIVTIKLHISTIKWLTYLCTNNFSIFSKLMHVRTNEASHVFFFTYEIS